MGFNFNIFEFGGGGGGGNGVSKYATAASLPGSAADGDLGIVLDTNNLYSYDAGVPGWVIIGGPGVAITVTDTNSTDLTLTLNVLTADLKIAGITTLPTGAAGVSLRIHDGASAGLQAFVQGHGVQEVTSSVLQFTGASYGLLGTSLGIQVNQASGSTPGYLSAADWTKFNNSIGLSSQIHTVEPIYGGTFLSQNSGITLFMPAATGSTFGYVTATGQTFGGIKAFVEPAYFASGSGATPSIVFAAEPANGFHWPSGGQWAWSVNNVRFWTFTSAGHYIHQGQRLYFYSDSQAALIGIRPPSTGLSSYDLVWPKSQGATTTYMMNDGQGGLTFSPVGISLGTFLAATSAVGATVTTALGFQQLAFTEAQTTNPGMVSPNAQTWNGVKTFAANVELQSFLRFTGASAISIGSSATTGYTLILPVSQGGTYTILQNDGRGNLSWANGSGGNYRTVTNAGATLVITDRFVEITTGVTNQTLNIGWAAAGNTGVLFTVQKIDSGLGSVTVQSPDLINGVTNYTFSTQWEAHQFVCNGLGFRVLT